ncbi:MAG: hypothetical protein GQ574_19005 [Crocinitomix sp.]|nr:hypothetical protein [Crocinitomix sp.]
MNKIIGYSAVAVLLFTAFFYFYDAAIFEAEIVETTSTYPIDVSLKAFLDRSALPESVSLDRLTSVGPTLKGILLLVVCLLGLPIMIGYRVATTNQPAQNSEPKKD